MKIVLLLTACIQPNSYDCLYLVDFDIRKQQYIESINWYLQNTNYDIIFVENSGHDLSFKFKNLLNRIEFLNYTSSKPSIYSPERGKGYKEMEILEYALHHSEKLKEAEILIKITGRLILLNIKKYEKYLPHRNIQNWCMANIINFNFSSDSRFIFCDKLFLKNLVELKEKINLKYSFEMALKDLIFNYPKYLNYKLIPIPFRIKGFSGGYGNNYYILENEYRKKYLKHRFTFIIKSIYYKVFIFYAHNLSKIRKRCYNIFNERGNYFF